MILHEDDFKIINLTNVLLSKISHEMAYFYYIARVIYVDSYQNIDR
jgi:hypothetical protein